MCGLICSEFVGRRVLTIFQHSLMKLYSEKFCSLDPYQISQQRNNEVIAIEIRSALLFIGTLSHHNVCRLLFCRRDDIVAVVRPSFPVCEERFNLSGILKKHTQTYLEVTKLTDIKVIAFRLENILGDIQTFDQSMSMAKYLFWERNLTSVIHVRRASTSHLILRSTYKRTLK